MSAHKMYRNVKDLWRTVSPQAQFDVNSNTAIKLLMHL